LHEMAFFAVELDGGGHLAERHQGANGCAFAVLTVAARCVCKKRMPGSRAVCCCCEKSEVRISISQAILGIMSVVYCMFGFF
jgi:hypothetical protein